MAIPAHRKQLEGDGFQWSTFRIVAVVAAAAIVVAGGVTTAVALTHGSSGSKQLTSASPSGGSAKTGGGSSSKSGKSGKSGSTGTTSTTIAVTPLSVTSITPAAKATNVATDQDISIHFSHELAANTPTPSISPDILGQWVRKGTSFVFKPTAGYVPATHVTVTVPASTKTVEGKKTVTLGKAETTSFTVGTGSVLRLQQLLAELGYLPLSFVRTSGSATSGASTTALVSSSGLASEPVSAAAISTNPKPGHFVWNYADTPATLQDEWQAGTYNTITQGAVDAFEGDHDLGTQYGWSDGQAGPSVWTALLKAVAARDMDPRPYSYIEVNEVGTEYLKVWQKGSIVYQSLANTGVAGAATAQGTFAIDSHLPSNLMTGTDVDGSHYSVTVYDAAYFNGGDAVHAYPRDSYGFPQSNGCVELPLSAAQELFTSGMDWYGTLVTVENTD
jgi:Bacterial Ig-like domain/L,D-transpeptidase catalytic domain